MKYKDVQFIYNNFYAQYRTKIGLLLLASVVPYTNCARQLTSAFFNLAFTTQAMYV